MALGAEGGAQRSTQEQVLSRLFICLHRASLSDNASHARFLQPLAASRPSPALTSPSAPAHAPLAPGAPLRVSGRKAPA